MSKFYTKKDGRWERPTLKQNESAYGKDYPLPEVGDIFYSDKPGYFRGEHESRIDKAVDQKLYIFLGMKQPEKIWQEPELIFSIKEGNQPEYPRAISLSNYRNGLYLYLKPYKRLPESIRSEIESRAANLKFLNKYKQFVKEEKYRLPNKGEGALPFTGEYVKSPKKRFESMAKKTASKNGSKGGKRRSRKTRRKSRK